MNPPKKYTIKVLGANLERKCRAERKRVTDVDVQIDIYIYIYIEREREIVLYTCV